MFNTLNKLFLSGKIGGIKNIRNLNFRKYFSTLQNVSSNRVHVKEFAYHLEYENNKKEEFQNLTSSKFEKYQIKNQLYQQFININNKINNSENLLKYFG